MTIVDGDVLILQTGTGSWPALKSTEGFAKAEVMGQRLRDINPDINLTIIGIY